LPSFFFVFLRKKVLYKELFLSRRWIFGIRNRSNLLQESLIAQKVFFPLKEKEGEE